MKTTKRDSLASIISSSIEDIDLYFKAVNKANITPKLLLQRIKAELPVKVDDCRLSIGKTTLSYLDADARESISQWQAKNKNHYYEAGLSEKNTYPENKPSIDEFVAKNYFWISLFIYSVLAAIIFISGVMLNAVTTPLPPSSSIVINDMTTQLSIIKLLVFAVVAVGSSSAIYGVIKKLTAGQEKTHILKQLSEYLNTVKGELMGHSHEVARNYSKEFDSLALELGEK